MKKVYTIIIALILVISLSGCNNPDNGDLENRVLQLENQVAVLNSRIDSLVTSTGLNGQVDVYENKESNKVNPVVSLTYLDLATEIDYVDETKMPSYVWDETNDYISLYQVNNMLCQKYLAIDCVSSFNVGYKIQAYKPVDMEWNDYMVRLSMMLVELSYYDYYTIDSERLYVEFELGARSYLITRMQILIDDKYSPQAPLFWNEYFEVTIEGQYFNHAELQVIYDEYIANGTFDGFVLPNYK